MFVVWCYVVVYWYFSGEFVDVSLCFFIQQEVNQFFIIFILWCFLDQVNDIRDGQCVVFVFVVGWLEDFYVWVMFYLCEVYLQVVVSDVDFIFINQCGQFVGRGRWFDVIGLQFVEICKIGIFIVEVVESLQYYCYVVSGLIWCGILEFIFEFSVKQILLVCWGSFQQFVVVDKVQIVFYQW